MSFWCYYGIALCRGTGSGVNEDISGVGIPVGTKKGK